MRRMEKAADQLTSSVTLIAGATVQTFPEYRHNIETNRAYLLR